MKDVFAVVKARIEAHFDAILAEYEDASVIDAMRYALLGGKFVRATLVIESAKIHHIAVNQAVWPACGIEAMHTYSLVHDDLPSMDNDEMRRGRPTVHRAWDEATAILTGDALQAMAFELTLDARGAPTSEARAMLGLRLASAAGGRGMVLGQARDIAAENAEIPLSLDEITALQAGKTGALIEYSATSGAIMAGSDPTPLSIYAKALGLAFQIQDDVIDVTGDAQAAGKAVGKDAAAGKATFVSLLGLTEAKRRAVALAEEASDALSVYGKDAETLRALAKFVVTREN